MSVQANPSKKVIKNYCVVCKEEIKPAAKICNECNSYQDWRQYIAFGNTTLALIVALVSVLSISAKYITELLPKSNESIVLGMLEANAEILQRFAYNDGDTYGILQPSAVLTLHLKDGTKVESGMSINPGINRDATSLIIKPGEVNAYFASYATLDRPINKFGTLILECEFSFVVKGQREYKRSGSFQFPCTVG